MTPVFLRRSASRSSYRRKTRCARCDSWSSLRGCRWMAAPGFRGWTILGSSQAHSSQTMIQPVDPMGAGILCENPILVANKCGVFTRKTGYRNQPGWNTAACCRSGRQSVKHFTRSSRAHCARHGTSTATEITNTKAAFLKSGGIFNRHDGPLLFTRSPDPKA